MSWQIEIPIIVRSLINDFGQTTEYSDERMVQIISVAARYTTIDIDFNTKYSIDVVNNNINPDPCNINTRDDDFISFVALKAACLLDQSTYRTKALTEGIKTKLGPAELDISGNLDGFKTILSMGPCALYESLSQQYSFGNISTMRAILSPFVGNNFDPQMLNTNTNNYRRTDNIIV